MARRFSDIKRAAKLQAALTGYLEYLSTPPSTTLPTYKARPEQKALMLSPFGLTLPGTGAKALVYAGVPSATRLQTVVAGPADIADAGNTAKKVLNFHPARVITFEDATKTVSLGTSKFTKQSYRKYGGERFAMPFGMKTAGDLEIDVADLLRTALKARAGLEVNRVSFTPERRKLA